jgi:hypothetical protein
MMRSRRVHQMRAAFRSALVERRQTRRIFRQAIRQALHTHRAGVIGSLKTLLRSAGPSSQPIDDAHESDELLALMSMRVLRIIESHPEGVRAHDIGNELGVDWRVVLLAARSLADAGLVQQVDQNFYAIRKASRTW